MVLHGAGGGGVGVPKSGVSLVSEHPLHLCTKSVHDCAVQHGYAPMWGMMVRCNMGNMVRCINGAVQHCLNRAGNMVRCINAPMWGMMVRCNIAYAGARG